MGYEMFVQGQVYRRTDLHARYGGQEQGSVLLDGSTAQIAAATAMTAAGQQRGLVVHLFRRIESHRGGVFQAAPQVVHLQNLHPLASGRPPITIAIVASTSSTGTLNRYTAPSTG